MSEKYLDNRLFILGAIAISNKQLGQKYEIKDEKMSKKAMKIAKRIDYLKLDLSLLEYKNKTLNI